MSCRSDTKAASKLRPIFCARNYADMLCKTEKLMLEGFKHDQSIKCA